MSMQPARSENPAYRARTVCRRIDLQPSPPLPTGSNFLPRGYVEGRSTSIDFRRLRGSNGLRIRNPCFLEKGIPTHATLPVQPGAQEDRDEKTRPQGSRSRLHCDCSLRDRAFVASHRRVLSQRLRRLHRRGFRLVSAVQGRQLQWVVRGGLRTGRAVRVPRLRSEICGLLLQVLVLQACPTTIATRWEKVVDVGDQARRVVEPLSN